MLVYTVYGTVTVQRDYHEEQSEGEEILLVIRTKECLKENVKKSQTYEHLCIHCPNDSKYYKNTLQLTIGLLGNGV